MRLLCFGRTPAGCAAALFCDDNRVAADVQLCAVIMKSLALALWLIASARAQQFTQGTLRGPHGDCPLQHTAVTASISGMMARVNVVQEFPNQAAEAIEATYTFPLTHDAAVDGMTMTVGGRTIRSAGGRGRA